MAQGPSDTILVAIRITLRILVSKVRNPDPPDRWRFVLSEHISCFLLFFLFPSGRRLADGVCACVVADSMTSKGDDDLSVKDYRFLSRLDALLDMLHAMDVLDGLQSTVDDDDTRPLRRRRRHQDAHVYSVRQYILKCCRQGFCDSADFC